jgi:hypothetical protein
VSFALTAAANSIKQANIKYNNNQLTGFAAHPLHAIYLFEEGYLPIRCFRQIGGGELIKEEIGEGNIFDQITL